MSHPVAAAHGADLHSAQFGADSHGDALQFRRRRRIPIRTHRVSAIDGADVIVGGGGGGIGASNAITARSGRLRLSVEQALYWRGPQRAPRVNAEAPARRRERAVINGLRSEP